MQFVGHGAPSGGRGLRQPTPVRASGVTKDEVMEVERPPPETRDEVMEVEADEEWEDVVPEPISKKVTIADPLYATPAKGQRRFSPHDYGIDHFDLGRPLS